MSATPIPALAVFGFVIERSESHGGGFDLWVTLKPAPRSEEAAEFVGHLQRLLQVHLAGHGLVEEAADGAFNAALGASLKDLIALNCYAAGHLEAGFWARMELLGLGVLLHALSEVEPQVLAEWWGLYSEAGGDPLDLLAALEAVGV